MTSRVNIREFNRNLYKYIGAKCEVVRNKVVIGVWEPVGSSSGGKVDSFNSFTGRPVFRREEKRQAEESKKIRKKK